jgi:RHS repeat-associated protein
VADKLFGYDERDRLTSLTDRLDAAASVSYGYDANGNQTSRAAAGITTRFRFDVSDQLIDVRREGELLGVFQYDYQGLRVAKRSGTGDTVRYVYDDQSALLQTDLAGQTIARYAYGPDRLLSLDHATEGRQFYLFDALGSPVDLVGADGGIRLRTKYDAWGVIREEVGTSWNPFGFTGHELDDETGLYYARARFYDPELGSFLSEDPWEGATETPPSLHRYLYAYGNPTTYFDPRGLEAQAVSATGPGQQTMEEDTPENLYQGLRQENFSPLSAALVVHWATGTWVAPRSGWQLFAVESGQGPGVWVSPNPGAAIAHQPMIRLDDVSAFIANPPRIGPGFAMQRYDALAHNALSEENTGWDRLGFGLSAAMWAFPAGIEELGRGLINTPHDLQAARAHDREGRRLAAELEELGLEYGDIAAVLEAQGYSTVLGPGIAALPVGPGGLVPRGLGSTARRVTWTGRGDQSAFAREAEELVSAHTNVSRNPQGAGQQTIPGSGPGGFRVPDLKVRGYQGSVRLRGTVVEIKASRATSFGELSTRSREQLTDSVAYVRRLRARAGMARDPQVQELLENVRVEVFSDVAAPTRGRFADLIEEGLIEWKLIPR